MNRVIKDLKDILEIHHVAIHLAKHTDQFVVIDPKQVAEYIYGVGYRKTNEYCNWKPNPDYEDCGGGYDTSCKRQFVSEYTLEECDAVYCQFCGKKIKVVKSKGGSSE